MLRDQRDELEIRLTTTNEARFSRLSGMFKFHDQVQSYSFHSIDNTTTDRLRIEESLKLKESILLAYRKQIDARRALLEVDSGLMDVIHEVTRNEAIVEQ